MIINYLQMTADQQGQGIDPECLQSPSPVQIFGDFPESLPESQEYLLLQFSPSSLPLKRRWRNNGLSANFLADYLVTFFPSDDNDPDTLIKHSEVQSSVSYIANELLENAMKFSDHNSPQPISIQLQLYPDRLVFIVVNSILPSILQQYQSFIQEVLASDPDEMLLHRLKQNAENDRLETSGLGLITMISNYFAKLGWKFEPIQDQPEIVTVTTMVQIAI